MSSRSSPWATRRTHEFIKAHRREFEVQAMCRALDGGVCCRYNVLSPDVLVLQRRSGRRLGAANQGRTPRRRPLGKGDSGHNAGGTELV